MFATLAQAAPEGSIEVVRLVRDGVASAAEDPHATNGTSIWLGAAAVVVVVLGLFACRAWARSREESSTLALRRLCSLLRLTRGERQMLGGLAGAITGPGGAPVCPAALLLSQDAFIRAASGAKGQNDEIGALHRKVFEATGTR